MPAERLSDPALQVKRLSPRELAAVAAAKAMRVEPREDRLVTFERAITVAPRGTKAREQLPKGRAYEVTRARHGRAIEPGPASHDSKRRPVQDAQESSTAQATCCMDRHKSSREWNA